MEKAKQYFHHLSPKGSDEVTGLSCPGSTRHPPAPGPPGAQPAHVQSFEGSPCAACIPLGAPTVPSYRAPGGRTAPAGQAPPAPSLQRKGAGGRAALAPTCLFQARLGEGPGRGLGGNLQSREGRRVREGAVNRKKSPPVSGEECEGGGTGPGTVRGAEIKCQAAEGAGGWGWGSSETSRTAGYLPDGQMEGQFYSTAAQRVVARTRVSRLGRASTRLTSTCPCARPLSLCQAPRGQTTLPFSAPGSYGGGEGRRLPCRPLASLCPPGAAGEARTSLMWWSKWAVP